MTPTEAMFSGKDWIYLVGLVVTVGTFMWKLITDTKYARYRETVAFVEKREKEMRERWARIKGQTGSQTEIEDDVYVFMGQLEMISLLVRNKAFDGELVYTFWWRYFDEPLQNSQINNWVLLKQATDSSLFNHYVALCEKWADRLDKEQGRIN